MPEQQPTVYKKWPKAIWESFCQEFAIFFSMAVSNTVLVDGVEIDSLDHVSHFGVCSTAAATQVKTVNCPQFNLVTGARIVVGFTVTNTASSVQLNVNNTGAVSVVYKGSSLPINALTANSIREFVYDGTNYQLIGDLDTTMSGVQAARVTLFEGLYNQSNDSDSVFNNKQILNDSIENYDCVEITVNVRGDNDADNLVTGIYNVTDIIGNKPKIRIFGGSTGNDMTSFCIVFPGNNYVAIARINTSSWGIGYGITKITGIKYIQPDSYSTTEKLIGTWIDGKPLYRRVFTNAGNNYDTGLINSTYEVKKVYGCAVTSTATYNIPNETDYLTVTHTGLIETNRQSALNWVAVEYTKITT